MSGFYFNHLKPTILLLYYIDCVSHLDLRSWVLDCLWGKKSLAILPPISHHLNRCHSRSISKFVSINTPCGRGESGLTHQRSYHLCRQFVLNYCPWYSSYRAQSTSWYRDGFLSSGGWNDLLCDPDDDDFEPLFPVLPRVCLKLGNRKPSKERNAGRQPQMIPTAGSR